MGRSPDCPDQATPQQNDSKDIIFTNRTHNYRALIWKKARLSGVVGLRSSFMDQRVINLYDRFTHGGMSRRDFLDQLATVTGSAAAAVAFLPLLANDYAKAAIVDGNDPRLASERISYESPAGKIGAYLSRDKAKTKRPAVIVIHENRGLNPHIEDVTRRMALEGFL